MKKIFIASSNEGKINEFKKILEPLNYEVFSILDLEKHIDIEETGKTFKENAMIKSQTMSNILKCDCLADDSGLEITCLNGEPGVYSARYLGHDTSYDIKNNELIKRVAPYSDRSCQYVCAISYTKYNGETKVFEATLKGEIAFEAVGSNGFGFDPIFYYPPINTTMANADEEYKNKVSHRYQALNMLLEYLND